VEIVDQTSDSPWLARLKSAAPVRFALYTYDRFLHDRCQQIAAALAYSTLFALVPLLAVGLAIFAAFPVFAPMRDALQSFVYRQFLPETGLAVGQYLAEFVANTGKLTLFGVVGIGISAILLLFTIESAFNQIWRVDRERDLVLRILRFWAALTLGPLLVGLGITIPGYVFAQAHVLGGGAIVDWPLEVLAQLGPFLVELIGFSLLYLVVPNRPQRIRHVVIGGIAATAQFEVLKFGFGWYLTQTASTKALYGALAAVPLLLLWLYLAWLVVLIGAVITAALADWPGVKAAARPLDQPPGPPLPPAAAGEAKPSG
jgi:membrane protein